MKKIYIGLLQTGTIASIAIKYITHFKYSHVVLALDDSYQKLYSFGRKTFYNIFNAGFVTYGIENEFFTKRFYNTKCAILEIEISNHQYHNLIKILKNFEENSSSYHYDLKGLFIRIFFEPKVRENYYVCSQFVAYVLEKSGIWQINKSLMQIRAKDFFNIPKSKLVYEGKLLDIKK